MGGNRYDDSEWLDFFAEPGGVSPELRAVGASFSNSVWTAFLAWGAEHVEDLADIVEAIDADTLAYKAYGSLGGHGIGLWDGDVFSEVGLDSGVAEKLGRSFEAWIKADRHISRAGGRLDDLFSMASEPQDEDADEDE